MENHGLVVSSDSAEQAIERTEEILHKIASYMQISYEAQPNATKLWNAFSDMPGLSDKIVYLSENRFLTDEEPGKLILTEEKWNHAFCPDCIVYGLKRPLFLAEDFGREDIAAFMESYGSPAVVCYMGRFYILAESVKKAQEIENVMSFAAQVQMANLSQEMNYLSDEQQDELLNWDSEKYRRML